MFGSMKVLEQVQIVAARKRLAKNTLDVYRLWIKRFITFSELYKGSS